MAISITKQIIDIKKKGIKEFIKKINIFFRKITKIEFWINKLVYAPLSLLILIGLIFISPFKKIRLGILHRRLGHFALNTEIYLLEKDIKKEKYLDIWFWPEFIPNKQIKKMISRVLITNKFESKFIYFVLLELKKILYLFSIKKFIIGSNSQEDRDINNLLDETSSKLSLTTEEINFGYNLLKKMGLDKNKPIVCLIVRDSAYLNYVDPKRKNLWKTQNYRDSNINDYLPAAKYLYDNGYQIIRMGSVVKEKINKDDKFIFDYANSNWRDDFMDVFLGYICKFTIANSTGWDAIPVIFRKPIIFVNHVPILGLHTYSKKYIHIFKHHYDSISKKNLNIKDIVSKNLHNVYEGNSFEQLHIQLKDNTQNEILFSVKEMIDLIDSDFKLPKHYLEKKLWEQYPKKYINTYNNNPMHGKIKSRFSSYFIETNKYLLSDD
tara:strand:+ start:544 stop:1854 length:1311 start_codon:yes stop_codon:yes gene_type:complete